MAVALSVGCGGCAFRLSGQDEGDHTGSITPPPAAAAAAAIPDVADSDLSFARAAVRDLLHSGEEDGSAPWENPKTGARGTVTPIATAYTRDGATCRDFIASYLRDRSESWLQGAACRADAGQWEVRNIRLWKRA